MSDGLLYGCGANNFGQLGMGGAAGQALDKDALRRVQGVEHVQVILYCTVLLRGLRYNNSKLLQVVPILKEMIFEIISKDWLIYSHNYSSFVGYCMWSRALPILHVGRRTLQLWPS